MSHDAERDAAAYLGGAMSSRQARRFEGHLVACEECWREVSEGRLGRSLAESGRDLAPAGLREDLRAALSTTPQRSPRRVIAATMGAAALLAVAVTALALTLLPSRQPGPIAEAVSDYRGARLAVSGPSARPAPELTGTGLGLVAEGGGAVGTLDVDAFVYRDDRGRRLLLYLSDRPFPVAVGAHRSDEPEGPWVALDSGVHLLCASRPESLLALSDDAGLLRQVASILGVQSLPA